MKTIISLAMLLGVLGFHQRAAEAGDWQITGTGCIADDNAIQGDDYNSGGHGVFARDLSSARFICPITDPEGTWAYMYMRYGGVVNSGPHGVVAKLKSAAFGGTSTTTHSICTAPTGSSAYADILCDFIDIVPSTTRHYWFEVTVTKNDTSIYDPEFIGITIF